MEGSSNHSGMEEVNKLSGESGQNLQFDVFAQCLILYGKYWREPLLPKQTNILEFWERSFLINKI